MTVTIHQDYCHEKGTLDDVINAVNGRNVIHNGVRVHIVDGDYRQALLGELLENPGNVLESTMESIEAFVTK